MVSLVKKDIQDSTNTTVNGIKRISDIIIETDTIVTYIAVCLEEESTNITKLITNIVQTGEGISE